MARFVPALILAAMHAQEIRVSSRPYTPSPFVLRVDTNLVETGVVVRDRNGHAIAGLKQSDFKILDDGREREITAFSVETSIPAAQTIATAVPLAASTEPSPPQSAAKPVIQPRYVALLFDDVHIKQGDIMHAKVAAQRFVREALQPGDRIAVYTTSGTRVLAFTADKEKLLDAIEKLNAHPRMDENGIAPCPRITPYQAYLIVRLDVTAMLAALDEAHSCTENPGGGAGGVVNTGITTALGDPSDLDNHLVQVQAEQTWEQAKTISQATLDTIRGVVDELGKTPGARVLLLASPGFLAETLEYDQNRIIDHALAANVVINSLDAKGLFSDTPVRTPDQLQNVMVLPMSTTIFENRTQLPALATAETPLINLAQATGGLFFHNSNDLTLGFRELAAVPEVTYHLGFQPGEGGEGRYHKLQVKLTKPGSDLVQSRRGYFAPAKGAAPDLSARQRLDQEVLAKSSLSDFPATVSVEPGKTKSGQSLVWVSAHIDLQRLPFTRRDEHELQGLIFITALLDANGNMVTAKEGRMDLELTEPTYARLIQTGVNARLSLEAPPGTYRLREVVQEAVDGKMAALNRTVRLE